jgi:hypothetical protein
MMREILWLLVNIPIKDHSLLKVVSGCLINMTNPVPSMTETLHALIQNLGLKDMVHANTSSNLKADEVLKDFANQTTEPELTPDGVLDMCGRHILCITDEGHVKFKTGCGDEVFAVYVAEPWGVFGKNWTISVSLLYCCFMSSSGVPNCERNV